MTSYLKHHGVKGQKWGVRRYQYADGSLTPAGQKRYRISRNEKGLQKVASVSKMSVNELINNAKFQITGRQYVDSYLDKGTDFYRIQTSKDFENFAFYATYKKADADKYMGLFGKNLKTRAEYAAKQAEKSQASDAKQLREYSDNLNVYQLKLTSTNKLKIPSDENAAHITTTLLKEPDFRKNLEASIQDSKEKMKRPTQQLLFKQAQNALKQDPNKMSSYEKIAIYKAFNLSLTNHNPQEIAAQNRFYTELKKKGYNALLDYNDKDYSSYHAKRPMIVFDTDSVRLSSVTETNPKVVNALYRKYNAERLRKEISANTVGYIYRRGDVSVSKCASYLKRKTDDYLQ